MMRQLTRLLACLVMALSLFAALPAWAQSADAELTQKLAKYDPAAVKAAQHYFEITEMKAAIAQSVGPVSNAIGRMIQEKNPDADVATLKEFVEIAVKVIYVDNAEFFEKFTIVTMLDIYTPEEIIAIDKFFSSDAGRSMLKKMPEMAARMPAMFEIMQKEIFPQALQKAQEALKAKGKNIRI